MLDRMGPHFYLRIAVAGLVASGLLYQVVGTSVVGVYIGAAVFGFAWGVAETIPRSYPPISRMTWMSSSASTRS